MTKTAFELDDTVTELKELQAQQEELNAQIEALKDKVKARMVELGTEELQGSAWKASWKNVTSTRFDTKRFKAEQPELYGTYAKESTTCRFVVG